MHDNDYCGLLLPQFRKLLVAMDRILLWRIYGSLCLPLFDLLFYIQDKHEWIDSDRLLLWVHVVDFVGIGDALWYIGSLGC